MKWFMVVAMAVSFLFGGMARAQEDNFDLDALLGDVGATGQVAATDSAGGHFLGEIGHWKVPHVVGFLKRIGDRANLSLPRWRMEHQRHHLFRRPNILNRLPATECDHRRRKPGELNHGNRQWYGQSERPGLGVLDRVRRHVRATNLSKQ